MDSGDKALTIVSAFVAGLLLALCISLTVYNTVIGRAAIAAGLQQGAVAGSSGVYWIEKTK